MVLGNKFGWFFLLIIFLLNSCSEKQPKLRPLSAQAIVVAFGDSLTAGVGATELTSYPQVLQNLIHLTVINAGVPGEETSDGLARIQKVMDQYQPALVIVCLGGNDVLRHRPVMQIKENLKKIIEVIKKNNAQIVLIAVPELTIYLTVPSLYQELGAEFNIPVMYTLLPTLLRTPRYKSDYIHLNSLGYEKMATEIAAFLKQQGAIK